MPTRTSSRTRWRARTPAPAPGRSVAAEPRGTIFISYVREDADVDKAENKMEIEATLSVNNVGSLDIKRIHVESIPLNGVNRKIY